MVNTTLLYMCSIKFNPWLNYVFCLILISIDVKTLLKLVTDVG